MNILFKIMKKSSIGFPFSPKLDKAIPNRREKVMSPVRSNTLKY